MTSGLNINKLIQKRHIIFNYNNYKYNTFYTLFVSYSLEHYILKRQYVM